jgi:sugar/nucleoside kinase (ribokinase family)
MKIARENGAWLSYDPNLRKPLWPSDDVARKEIFSIWDQADMIKVSCSSILVNASPISVTVDLRFSLYEVPHVGHGD